MTHANETPRARLNRLRAELAEREQTAQPTTQTASAEPLPVRPADVIHTLRTGVTISVGNGFMSSGHVTTAGENIVVTQNMIDASRDNFGNSWMALIGDDDAQLAAWGEVRFRFGPAPADVQTWNTVGDSDWVQQREAARREAWQQPTAQARAEALAAVHARFGPAPTTSVTLNRNVDPTIRQAEEQQRELDEGGVRLSWMYSAVEPAHEALKKESGQKGDRR